MDIASESDKMYYVNLEVVHSKGHDTKCAESGHIGTPKEPSCDTKWPVTGGIPGVGDTRRRRARWPQRGKGTFPVEKEPPKVERGAPAHCAVE